MSNKLLLNTNINVILGDFESALKVGYRFVPGRSDLFTSISGLHEMTLYKQNIEVQLLSYEDAFETVVIENYDKTKVLCQLQQYVLSGYQIQPDKTLWFDLGSKRVVVHNPEHPSARTYTKEELYDMPYEELKVIGRLRNCFNRGKDVMIAGILKYDEDKLL